MSERTFAAADLTAMKIIDIRGIPNMEPVRGGTDEWYWATDYIHGDLYEAEELFRDGHPVKSNRLYLIHYPDGAVYEPVPPVDGQYLGYPVYDGGTVALLAVNFAEQVIRILRDPENGCPWDKVQTHASIRKNFLEETCEALEAIDADDAVLLREELGDVLMQVVFHAAMEEERGRFTFEDVCRNVCEKLVFRHPNIFASSAAENAGINGWDALKNKEKGRTTLADELATVPATLPALMRAQKLQKRAAGHGLGQQDAAAAQHQLEAAVQAFAKAEDTAKQEAAGQLLFAAVNAARLAGVDAEEALTFASKRFAQQCLEQKQSGIQVE